MGSPRVRRLVLSPAAWRGAAGESAFGFPHRLARPGRPLYRPNSRRGADARTTPCGLDLPLDEILAIELPGSLEIVRRAEGPQMLLVMGLVDREGSRVLDLKAGPRAASRRRRDHGTHTGIRLAPGPVPGPQTVYVESARGFPIRGPGPPLPAASSSPPAPHRPGEGSGSPSSPLALASARASAAGPSSRARSRAPGPGSPRGGSEGTARSAVRTSSSGRLLPHVRHVLCPVSNVRRWGVGVATAWSTGLRLGCWHPRLTTNADSVPRASSDKVRRAALTEVPPPAAASCPPSQSRPPPSG